jgi:hypothetical protein
MKWCVKYYSVILVKILSVTPFGLFDTYVKQTFVSKGFKITSTGVKWQTNRQRHSYTGVSNMFDTSIGARGWTTPLRAMPTE